MKHDKTKPKTRPQASSSSRPAPPRPAPPRVQSRTSADAAPEIVTGYTAAGRETLAAIAEELATELPSDVPDAGPEIVVEQSVAGRETLAAIAEELLAPESAPRAARPPTRETVSYEEDPGPPRARMRTVGFEERSPPFRRVVSRSPPAAARPRPTQASMEAIENELATWAKNGQPPGETAADDDAAIEVFEMATFVARGDLARLSSTAARRRFVENRLLHRLPVRSMSEVDRIDVTPWTVRGTVVVRVWCRVPPRTRV